MQTFPMNVADTHARSRVPWKAMSFHEKSQLLLAVLCILFKSSTDCASLVDAVKLLAGFSHSGSVDDGSELLQVVDDSVEE